MMEGCRIVSYLLTNELRLLLGLGLVAGVVQFSLDRQALLLAVFGGGMVTLCQAVSLRNVGVVAVELLVMAAIARSRLRGWENRCLFLMFFYEVGVGLWDFLIPAWLGVAFRSERFLAADTLEHLAGIWAVRLLLAAAVFVLRGNHPPFMERKRRNRLPATELKGGHASSAERNRRRPSSTETNEHYASSTEPKRIHHLPATELKGHHSSSRERNRSRLSFIERNRRRLSSAELDEHRPSSAEPNDRGPSSAAAARLVSFAAIAGLFGAVTLSQQTVLPMDEDEIGTWIILSMILLFAVLFYRLSRQRETELELAKLREEQAEILERDYEALSRTYDENAKLYHDLHNHLEVLYHCLARGDVQEAMQYCEDLRTPIREISQTVWTGDKALDYLISSKVALARQEQIRTEVKIEYPRNTNIRSVDLTTILGNLLNNALEAARMAPEPLRFLNLTIRRIHEMLIVKVENGYGEAPVQENGALVTSKENRTLHGWGLKSALTAAERYDGSIQTDYADGVFRAVVTLSFQPVKTESKSH